MSAFSRAMTTLSLSVLSVCLFVWQHCRCLLICLRGRVPFKPAMLPLNREALLGTSREYSMSPNPETVVLHPNTAVEQPQTEICFHAWQQQHPTNKTTRPNNPITPTHSAQTCGVQWEAASSSAKRTPPTGAPNAAAMPAPAPEEGDGWSKSGEGVCWRRSKAGVGSSRASEAARCSRALCIQGV